MTVHHIFCDESHRRPHAYRVQGGIWVPADGLRDVRAAFAELRAKHPAAGELRWGKVDGKEPRRVYHDLIDLFLTGPAAKHLHFNCIVVNRADDPSDGKQTAEQDLGFYKAYWTLLSYRLVADCRYHIRLDERSSPRAGAEEQLRDTLNRTAFGRGATWGVESCRGVCSKQEDLVQFAHVLCDVIGWAWNGRKSTCAAKPALEGYIASHLNWESMRRSTGMMVPKVNIWKYAPKRR